MLHDQETLWRETMAEGLSIEREAQQGGLTPTEVAVFHPDILARGGKIEF